MSTMRAVLHDEADNAIREILRLQFQGTRALVVEAPPGSGKTGLVERLAAQAVAHRQERCMIATQTNEQTFELVRRLVKRYSTIPIVLMHRRGLTVPEDLRAYTNLFITDSSQEIPAGCCIAIATSHRWSWSHYGAGETPFDLQIIDEAFQLPDGVFHQIAGLARRVVQVGDPGQIDPVITCEIEKWSCDPSGPHVPCPRALIARHPETLQLSLPISRRLVPDTVQIIQPAFYPNLPFRSLCAAGERRLTTAAIGVAWPDRAINLVEKGASIVYLALPSRVTGEFDEELSTALVDTIDRLFQRGTSINDLKGIRAIKPHDIGVICAHVSQVNAVRERFSRQLAEVTVETADRFQGLEREIMFVHHPLSGRADASTFHLDAGRLCVMLSRHRVACFVFGRQGISDLLLKQGPNGARVFGSQEDEVYKGWRAHLTIMQELDKLSRIILI